MADLASLPQRLVEQSDMWPCDYLKKPLPLDSTCSRVLLVTHELYVAGDDAELFCREIKESQSSAVQDRSVYCCAATSGVGKTRLAYAVGKFMTTILIMVADKAHVNR